MSNIEVSELSPADSRPCLTLRERLGIVEAILFVSGDAVEKNEIMDALGLTESEMEETLEALDSEYEFDRRGMVLVRYGTHLQLATRSEYAPYIEKILRPIQKQSLSSAVLETLAIIAYRQPVTKLEVESIRGVKCDYSIQLLQAKGLIQEVGRRETVGHPILYGTTDEFLRHFAIKSLEELPQIDFTLLSKSKPEENKDGTD